MDISLIISLAVALLGAIAVIVTMYRKLKKALGDLIKDGGWKKLFPIILNAIAEAEATGKKLLWRPSTHSLAKWEFSMK